MAWPGGLACAALLLVLAPPAVSADPHVNFTPAAAERLPADGVQAELTQRVLGAPGAAEPDRERWVFLVHGILMSKSSMAYLEERLHDAGFRVVNRSYPSTRLTVQEASDFLRRRIERRTDAQPDIEVNLVTHSMGGLVARHYLTHTPPKHFGALVQIAPPNKGSEKATRFQDFFFYRWVYRQPGQQLLTDLDALQKEIGYPTGHIGVIAGGTRDAEGFSPVIDGDDDGTVSVANTELPTMTDHIVLRYSHAFIMRKRETADQVIQFLNHGRFKRAAPADEQDRTLVAAE